MMRDDLGAAVAEALVLGRAPEAERRRFVAANSWPVRQEQIVAMALALS